jgi:hypothetical protein
MSKEVRMKKTEIKAGKFKLIPITPDFGIEYAEKNFLNSSVFDKELNKVKLSLLEYEAILLVCDIKQEKIIGKVLCRPANQDFKSTELLFENLKELPMKDFCNIVYYSSQWIFKFAGKHKVLMLNDNFDKELINRLFLLEFKKSKLDGYLERIAPNNDPTTVILSVLSGL